MKFKITALALLFLLSSMRLAASTSGADELPLKVVVNEEDKGDYIITATGDGDYLLSPEDIYEIGFVNLPAAANQGRPVSLRSLHPAVTFRLDEREPTLRITADPKLLGKKILTLGGMSPERVAVSRLDSFFLNYNAHYSMLDDFRAGAFNLDLEAGARIRDVLGYSSFSYIKGRSDQQLARLLTNLTWDDVGSAVRYVAGDVAASSGPGGSADTIGGIGVSKNFSMTPYFVRYPVPDVSGIINTPSDVEIFVNGLSFGKRRVYPGEFSFLNVPLSVGSGTTRLVIKDAFGREQTFIQPFLISSDLLKPGLNEYSYNLGFKREALGQESFGYGGLVFMGFHRRGFTDWFTGGLRGEADKRTINAGPLATVLLGKLVEADASIAASRRGSRYGYRASVSLSYPGRSLSAGLTVDSYSKEYADLNTASRPDYIPKFSYTASLGIPSRTLGSLSVSYTHTSVYAGAGNSSLSVLYNRALLKNLSVYASYLRRMDSVNDNTFIVGLNFFAGRDINVSASNTVNNGASTAAATVQKSAPVGVGYGYSVTATKEESQDAGCDAKAVYNSPYAGMSVNYTRVGESNLTGFNIYGGVAFVKGDIYFSRPINDSFALVKVGKAKNVKVMYNNQEMGNTNGNGELLVPGLISYYNNAISLVGESLPMDYNIAQTTKTASPPYRGCAFVDFQAEVLHAVEGRIYVITEGRKTPARYAGIYVEVNGETMESALGREGEFYMDDLRPGSYPARLVTDTGECRFELNVPESAEPIIELGEIYCEMH